MTMRLKTDAIDLPEIDPALEFLIGNLFDAGPVSVAGMGTVPLTWMDLDAWQRQTGVESPPWQLRMLRRLSSEYLQESRAAVAFDAPPPWNRVADRAKMAAHVKSFLRD